MILCLLSVLGNDSGTSRANISLHKAVSNHTSNGRPNISQSRSQNNNNTNRLRDIWYVKQGVDKAALS